MEYAVDKLLSSPSSAVFHTDLSLAPELVKLHDIPIYPCFALMLAFNEPLSLVPAKGQAIEVCIINISFRHILTWLASGMHSERWVLHSTTDYAKDVIAQSGLEKPSKETLSKVGNEMLQEFLSTGLSIPQPFFMKAHRWGSAFPATSIAKEEKCVWSEKKKLAICGDFCLSPNVEGAILSGLAAASKLKGLISTL
ncbi:tRNA 5-methylaminomethyl-2-thiouridine biosynthesis bifunctional MnmC [Gossypium australe]|uniref:tRNA 5-methylaminomethyl-2-thiouridine biosynthesis bifunctional MnmC n=1 Tax=Gossypium australe TaxID=47621 RepID=A0A5B6WYQ2_9ROSI|nr:tRNA 5-methylaminomethyl-2-thiouridine biosynthesis bifunctional MnmC [Gossypium australe]